jgi:CubicO group peptidase (beta-lactamase class C family)
MRVFGIGCKFMYCPQNLIQAGKSETMSRKIQKICLKFCSIAVFLLLLQPLQAQQDWSELDAFLESKKKELGKDFIVAAWKMNDTLVYKKEMGMFNSRTQAPVSGLSQLLTTALVLVLVDEGKLSLDDKVSTYLPEFARYGKNYITLRTCLSHTTGVADKGKFLSKVFQPFPSGSLEEEANSYAKKDIRANPTEDFWFGNLGINIAGRVLEVAMKKRFDILAKQKLFTPLTMRRSTFSTIDGSPVNPAGSAMTTAEDLTKFLAMLMNKGTYGGKQILSEESVTELLRVHAAKDIMKSTPEIMASFNYALGAWALKEQEGQATAIACPGWGGAFLLADWEKGYGFFVLPKEKLKEEETSLYLAISALIEGVM